MTGYKSHRLKRTCHMHQGCGCSPRGCGLTLLLLYLMQCLATTAARWHKYDTRTIEGVQLTLYYPAHEKCIDVYTRTRSLTDDAPLGILGQGV